MLQLSWLQTAMYIKTSTWFCESHIF